MTARSELSVVVRTNPSSSTPRFRSTPHGTKYRCVGSEEAGSQLQRGHNLRTSGSEKRLVYFLPGEKIFHWRPPKGNFIFDARRESDIP